MSILTKIRQRPDNEKKIFSFVSAGVLTLVIFIVWISFGSDPSETQIVEDDKLSSISPIEVMKEEFSKAISNFNIQTENITGSTSSSTIEVEIVQSTTTATSSKAYIATSTNE